MKFLVYLMIGIGIILMIVNIFWFAYFAKRTQDVLSAGVDRDSAWKKLAFVLLIFFLCGYIGVAAFGQPDLMVAGILFGGSVFVSIVIMLMSHLIETAKERSIDITEVLISVIEARDPNLNGHSRYVQNVTMLIYEYLPSSMKADINPVSLEYAAILHDVGKLGVPESILNKPGKLNDEEWEIMKNHPKYGVDILKPLRSFEEIKPWILYHHERIDGKGYYSLPGEQIPFPARIIAVADTYSAITMRRSYKPPRPYEEAISVIREVAGSQLDKEVVAVFCMIPAERLDKCVPEFVEVW